MTSCTIECVLVICLWVWIRHRREEHKKDKHKRGKVGIRNVMKLGWKWMKKRSENSVQWQWLRLSLTRLAMMWSCSHNLTSRSWLQPLRLWSFSSRVSICPSCSVCTITALFAQCIPSSACNLISWCWTNYNANKLNCHLHIHHGVVQPCPHHSDQLMTGVDNFWPRPLVVMPVPLLHAAFHLRHIVRHQGQMLETMTSSDQSQSDEILERECVEGPLQTTRTLDSVVYIFCHWVGPPWIIMGSPGILLVENGLVPFEAFHLGVIDILSEGNKSGRRSIGSRHFVWRTGQWCRRQQLTLLLSAHDRHALIWSSLPLPRDLSVCWSDKPQIFLSHLALMFIGVWTIFTFHLTHLCSIFVTLCHPTHPYLLLPHLIFQIVSQCYSFYIYLPLCLLLGMVCAQDLP